MMLLLVYSVNEWAKECVYMYIYMYIYTMFMMYILYYTVLYYLGSKICVYMCMHISVAMYTSSVCCYLPYLCNLIVQFICVLIYLYP